MYCMRVTLRLFFLFYVILCFYIPFVSSDNLSTQNIIDTSTSTQIQPPLLFSDLLSALSLHHHFNLSSSPAPQNITDYYKGHWLNVSPHYLPQPPAPSNIFPYHSFPFTKSSGQLLIQFQLTDNQPPSNSTVIPIDLLKGDMVFRDGIWSTDDSRRYAIQGIYFRNTGDLIFIANPFKNPVIQNIQFTLNDSTNVDNVIKNIQNEFSKHYFDNPTFNESLTETFSGINDFCFWQIFLKTQKPFLQSDSDTQEKTQLKGMIYSPNCQKLFAVEVEPIQFDAYYKKATRYVLIVTFISAVQILFLLSQMSSTATQASAAKVSLITIGQQAVLDAYLCLIHLTTGIVMESVFNPYATASFFKFIIFSIFEMRYLLLIWKARRPQQFGVAFQSMRRELSLLYARFYAFIMFGFIFIYYFHHLFSLFVFGLYSFWVPQIICNAIQDTNNALTKKYVLAISITRLFIPLYFYGCPYNFLHAEPSFNFVTYIVGWMVLQVVILFTQDILGPRFFVPSMFLPEKYDYRRTMDLEEGEEKECVICMSTVTISEDYMITPCNHVFHSHCLRQWMEMKMECPTCRGPLPYP